MTITIDDIKREFPNCIIGLDNIGNVLIRTSTIEHGYSEIISIEMMKRMEIDILKHIKEQLKRKIEIDTFKSYCERCRTLHYPNIMTSVHINPNEIIVHPEKLHEMQQWQMERR